MIESSRNDQISRVDRRRQVSVRAPETSGDQHMSLPGEEGMNNRPRRAEPAVLIENGTAFNWVEASIR